MSTTAHTVDPARAVFLGSMPFADAHALQHDLLSARASGAIPDTLLLLTHPPVVTAGRSTTDAELASARSLLASSDIPVVEVERGGRLTFHHPGQLIAYPIFSLDLCGRDLHRWLSLLEEATVRTLAAYSVDAHRDPAARGVWTCAGKIASVGVAVRRWVSYHGVALNVGLARVLPGLSLCGLSPDSYIGLADLGVEVELSQVARVFAKELADVCGLNQTLPLDLSGAPGGLTAERVAC
jgi:lipoate-protein ligase B